MDKLSWFMLKHANMIIGRNSKKFFFKKKEIFGRDEVPTRSGNTQSLAEFLLKLLTLKHFKIPNVLEARQYENVLPAYYFPIWNFKAK